MDKFAEKVIDELTLLCSVGHKDKFIEICEKNDMREIFFFSSRGERHEIVKFCIEINYNLDIMNSERTSAICWLCVNRLYDELELLLDKNVFSKEFYFQRNVDGLMQFDYFNEYNERTKAIADRIFKMEYKQKILPELKFRVYQMSEFEVINYKKNKHGSYGEVLHVKHIDTKIHMVIKKYKNLGKSLDFPIREIDILRYINDNNPNIVNKIYGVIYEGADIHLVLEHLAYTFHEKYSIVSNDEEYLENDLKSLIKIIHEINSMGISHNDIKPENIMFDINGNMKLIDFSIADFIGLLPTKYISKHILCLDTMGVYDAGRHFICENGERKYGSPLRSLNTDICGVGSLFIKIIYQIKQCDICVYMNHEFYVNGIRKYFKMPKFKFLFNCIEFCREKRYLPLDALNALIHNNIVEIKSCENNFPSINLPNIYSYKNDEDREMVYREDIFEYQRFKIVHPHAISIHNRIFGCRKQLKNSSMKMLEFTLFYKFSLDVYFNALILMLSEKKDDSMLDRPYPLHFNDELDIDMAEISYLFAYILLFEHGNTNPKSLSEQEKRDLRGKISNRYRNLKSLNFVSFMSCIAYLITELQIENIARNRIEDIYNALIVNVVIFLNLNKTITLTAFEVVLYSYYSIPSVHKVFWRSVNEKTLNKFKNILKCNTSTINEKSVSSLFAMLK